MKNLSPRPGLLALVFGAGLVISSCSDAATEAPASSGLLWRSHHAGRAALAQGTNASRLKAIDQLPATAALRAQVASNLAQTAHQMWSQHLPAGTPEAASLLRPLFDDLLQAETIVEVRGPLGRTESAVAIQLTDARAELWSTNLWQLANRWKLGVPRATAAPGAPGWEVKRTQAPNLLQFTRSGQWVVVGLGQDKLSLAPALVQQVARSGRPPALTAAGLLEVQADLPGLGARFPWLKRYGLPPVQLTLRGQGETVRTEARFQFGKPVPWKSEPWQIPTNLIGEPLTSFTVARGVAPLLNAVPGLANLGLTPLPNQISAWGISNEQCRAYLAAPVASSAGAIARLAPTLPAYVQTNLGRVLGEFLYFSNRAYLAWGNIPFIQPYLQSTTNAGHQFIHGGVFPLPPRQVPAPPDLFAQLGNRNNLLYYDWEITPQRLWNSRLFIDLINILSQRYPQRSDSPSKNWLTAILPELWGDGTNPSQTVTEISQSAPNELLLVRKSHLGLTGFELALLSAWLDSPGFPLDYVPPKPVPSSRDTNAAAGARGPAPAATPPRARPPTVPAKP